MIRRGRRFPQFRPTALSNGYALPLGMERITGRTRAPVGAEGIPMRHIAEAIGEGLELPVRGISAQAAPSHFGWIAAFVPLDMATSGAITRETLGWAPRETDLLTDLADAGHFPTPTLRAALG